MRKIFIFLSLLILAGFFTPRGVYAGYCGDDSCGAGEDCANCPSDCGSCPTPTSTPTPAGGGYCGDTDCCREEEYDAGLCSPLEGCDICIPDCGSCYVQGMENCGGGDCPPGGIVKSYITYCYPSCAAVPRTCHNDPSCDWPPPNCNDDPAGICYYVDCGKQAIATCGSIGCCGTVVCAPGGNCYSDCTACGGPSPTLAPTLPPGVTPTPTPTPPCVNTRPMTPLLMSPLDGGEVHSPDVTLSWFSLDPTIGWGTNCAGNVNTYRVYLDTNPDPSTLRCDVGSGTTTCTVTGLVLGTEYHWKVMADNGWGITTSSIWSFTFTYSAAWFQTDSGDVHGQSGVSSPIPSTCTPASGCTPYFSLDNTQSYPGVVSYQVSYDFDDAFLTGGEGNVSSMGWLAESSYSPSPLYDYDWFYDKLSSSITGDFTGDLPTSDGVYHHEGDISSLNGNWSEGSRIDNKIIILIDGDLTIDKRIEVDASSDGFLAFIVSGDITIDPSIGNNPAASGTRDRSVVEGVFIADGVFATSVGDPGKGRFVGQGIFKAGSFDLDRDLDTSNETIAAELFIFRPDLVINSPRTLWPSRMTWQEVAP